MRIAADKTRRLISADESRCAGCRTCMLRCSFRNNRAFNLSTSRIQIKRLVNHDHEFKIAFTKECDVCGVCARYCPYGALIQPQDEVEK